MTPEAGVGSRRYDAVVVGSGFGGGIAALRLAEAGRSVLVLERGRRYAPADFPRDVTDIDALFWRYPARPSATGLYDLRFFSGIGVVVASGVGGGSLVYANINIRPDARVFDDPRWPRGLDRGTLDPYFDRVAAALGVAPLPAHLQVPKRDAFRAAARRLGREVFDPDEAVRWEASDGERGPCQLIAECEFGCPLGAKNSVDVTYLAAAERLGAEVRTGVHATHVQPTGDGYTVHYRDVAGGATHAVAGTRVVLSAGTLGTNEILLRSRDETRTLPALSATLGHGFSGNGDFLGSIQNSATPLDPWYGPDVTSVMRYFDELPGFTLAAPTFSRPVMEVLASLGQPTGAGLGLLAPLLWRLLPVLLPLTFKWGLWSRPRLQGPNAGDPGRMTNLFAIGQDSADGVVELTGGAIDVRWDYAQRNQALVARMQCAMEDVARIYGGTFAPLVTWNVFRRILTVHPLGGCHLSESPRTGVVSVDGEVHGYPGLFVADGSVVPTSIGFHPAMTIAALAEHTAEAVVASFSPGRAQVSV